MKNLIVALVVCAASACTAWSQAKPAASRIGDLQLGVDYSTAQSDYVVNRIRGFGFYGDFDFREHYGVEASFHQLDDPNSAIYERSYEFGGRYLRHYNRFAPYAKALYGRGVFNYVASCADPTSGTPVPCDGSVQSTSQVSVANLAYNMAVAGAGVDFAVHPRINVRADFEYQKWFGFTPNGLTPSIISFGVAYHFSPGKPTKIY